MSRAIKVLLIDEQNLVRAGVALLLKSMPDVSVVGGTDSFDDAMRLVERHESDVVILNIDTDGPSGIELLAQIRSGSPNVKLIVLAQRESEVFVRLALEAGADGYLSTRITPEELGTALEEVMEGNRYISNDVARQIALDKLSNEERAMMSLSRREFTVFRCLAQGKTMAEIADEMSISPKTGYVFRSRVLEKLNTKNVIELTQLAQRHRVV